MKTTRALRLIALLIGGLQVMSCATPNQTPGPTMGLGLQTSEKQIQAAHEYARRARHQHGHADDERGGPPGYRIASHPLLMPHATRFGEAFEGMKKAFQGRRRTAQGGVAQTPAPTTTPTVTPTPVVTLAPTTAPTSAPTSQPTLVPTSAPTTAPTGAPTSVPTSAPTSAPTTAPTTAPTSTPTTVPVTLPTPLATLVPTPAPEATSLDAKLLVVSADGNEPSLAAIKQTLDYMGTPYTVWIATQNPLGLTPDKLSSGSHGNYQGVILADNTLGIQLNGQYVSAFSAAEWSALSAYEAAFGVRQVDWYTFPTAELGFGTPTAVATDTSPVSATLTPAGQGVFSYLNPAATVQISKAYTYLAPADATSTPLLADASGNALAVVHTYPDGRETLAQTFDNNAFLVHSEALAYGLVHWVTKGLFLGERHTYATAQVDDLFNDNDIFPPTTPINDPREHAVAGQGTIFRLNGADVQAFASWQQNLQGQATTADFKADLPFNGIGTTATWLADEGYPANDDLTAAMRQLKGQFKWLSHTYTHPYLDAISYADCTSELINNWLVADDLQLSMLDRTSLITPNVSGLTNASAMKAIADQGIRYVVSDTSVAGQNNPTPNTGIANTVQPSVLEIPRRPTNLFYNVSTPNEWVAEYNKLYASYWGHDVTYSELLDKESDVLLGYLLKGENDPWMFHQPNMRAYDGTHSLLGDLLDRTFGKYNSLMSFPVVSPTMSQLGDRLAARMSYNAANVTASFVPGVSITLTAQADVTVPVTGSAAGASEVYAGTPIGYVSLKAGQSATLPL